MTFLTKNALGLALGTLLAFTLVGCSSDDGDMGETESMGSETGMDDFGPSAVGMQDSEIDEAAAERERREALVTDLVAQAIAASNEGRHADAKAFYRQALDYDPTNVDAARGYDAMVKILTGAQESDDAAYDEAILRLQATRAKARFLYNSGLEARAEGKLDRAVDDLDKAYQLLKFNESPLTTDLKADVVKRALDETRELRDRAERERLLNEQNEVREALAQQELEERQRLERRKRALWDRLVDVLDKEQYGRAVRIADEIIRIDFKDEEARRVREMARKSELALMQRDTVESVREEMSSLLEDIKLSMIPQTETVEFPADWERRAARRPARISPEAEEVSEADRAVQEKLANTVLPRVDWTDKTLGEVVEELRAQVGVNIYVTPEGRLAAEDAGELSLEFTQVSADYALRAALAQLGVVHKVQSGLVKIQTREESARNKVVEFYDVRDLVSPIQSFPGVALNLNPSGVGLDEFFGGDDFGDEEPNQAIEIDRLIDLIKRAVDPAWDEDAGNRLDPKSGTLIVRQTPEKHRKVRQLLDDLRRNTGIQVSIETRFVEIENNFLQDIGVDLRDLGPGATAVGGSVPGPGTAFNFDDFGAPGGTGVGTTATPAGIGTSRGAGVFFSDRNGNTNVAARTENLFNEVLGDPNTLSTSGGLSFQFAYLDDVQLEAILRAVEKYERINTVTAPNLLVYNTQRANLTVLQEVSYVKDFDVEIAQASVIADPIIDKVREGVVLDVRPIVSHDRRFITLELRPTVATLVRPIRQFTTTLSLGRAVTIQLPELRKQSVSTTVVIPDQGTLLLGGLKFAQEQTLDSGVPILKDIPILSFFFSRTGKSTNQRDVIILLKAKIVLLDELEPRSDDLTRG